MREIDQLASLFDRVEHVAPLHGTRGPATSIPYTADNIDLSLVPPSGGPQLRDKLGILWRTPHYARTILRATERADVVHVRCPANISLIALLLLAGRQGSKRRWFKYAGNWNPEGPEPFSYRMQRWWLRKNLGNGLVTVNGSWGQQGSHIRTFYNPSLSADDLRRGAEAIREKRLIPPIRLLFVGRLEAAKGVGRALQVTGLLRDRGLAVELDLVGDGPEQDQFHAMARNQGLASYVRFHGWQSPDCVRSFLAEAHFMLFPSSASEGWPKVISEGMAFGAVPVVGAVSSIPQYIDEFGCGTAIEPHDQQAFADAIERYCHNPQNWTLEQERGLEAAHLFSFPYYLEAVRQLLDL